MEGAIKIWGDVISWATSWFVKILDSFGGWPVYVLSVLVFSAVAALVVPAFSGSLRSDLSDHRSSDSKGGK